MVTIAVVVACTLVSFSDFLVFAHSSRLSTLKYQTHLCVIAPLVVAFLIQPGFILSTLRDSKSTRRFSNVIVTADVMAQQSSQPSPLSTILTTNRLGNPEFKF